MIPISEALRKELNNDSQSVLPKVKAWMSDMRYMTNLKVSTSSHSYGKQILDRKPLLYLPFEDAYERALSVTAVATISIAAAAVVSTGPAFHGLLAGTPVSFSTTGALPSGIVAGKIYYVQRPFLTGFYLNTQRWAALENSSISRVATGSPQSGVHSYIVYKARSKDIGSNSFNFSYGKYEDNNYVWFPGVNGSYISTPDAANNSFTGSFSIVAKLDNSWGSGARQTIISKYAPTASADSAKSYTFDINTSGYLRLMLNSGVGGVGSEVDSISSNPLTTFGTGGVGWVAVSWNSSTKVVTFYTSHDGVSWAWNGTTANSVISVNNSTTAVTIGSRSDGILNKLASSRVYKINCYSGLISLSGTTLALPSPNPTFSFNAYDFASGASTSAVTTDKYGFGAGTSTWTIQNTGNSPAYPVKSNFSETKTAINEVDKISGKTKEILINERLEDTFNRADQDTPGFFSSNSLYSWGKNKKKWAIRSNKLKYLAGIYDNDPGFVYLRTNSLDHYVDFKSDGKLGSATFVRFVDEKNYISVGNGKNTNANVDAIVDGVVHRVASLSGVFVSSKYYRIRTEYNMYHVFDMGVSMPTKDSADGTWMGSGYFYDPIFRTEDAKRVGLGFHYAKYNLPSGSQAEMNASFFEFDYFAAYGFNYTSGSYKFDEEKYLFASKYNGNTVGQFETINSATDFTLSFLLRDPISTGIPHGSPDLDGTIFWLGNSAKKTGIRVNRRDITSAGPTYRYTLEAQIFAADGVTSYTLTWPSGSFDPGTLYHISIIKSGARFSMYINNVEVTFATLPLGFAMNNVSAAADNPLIGIGADLTQDDLGGGYSYHFFNGWISELAFFGFAFDQDDRDSLYYSIENLATLSTETCDMYYDAERAFDGIQEETFTYAFTNMLSRHGKVIKANNHVYCPASSPNQEAFVKMEGNFGWMSRVKSASDKSFSRPDFLKASFDAMNCNRVFVSTGYYGGPIKGFDYSIEKADGFFITGSTSFDTIDPSFIYIDLDDTYSIVSIKITPTSTLNALDYARIITINPIWEVDLSELVISFNLDKVRDNFDSSLPIGSTAANNGSIEFDNTEVLFNNYDPLSIYGDYINPDTKIFISLSHDVSQVSGSGYESETVVLATEMYADQWSLDSSSMVASVTIRDYSKFLQEKTVQGYVARGFSASKAIADLALHSGFPLRKIDFFDKYQQQVTVDEPFVYVKFNETQPDIDTAVAPGGLGHTHHIDEYQNIHLAGFYSGLESNPTADLAGTSLLYSDFYEAQDIAQRSIDDLAIKSFTPYYKQGSVKAESIITDVKTVLFSDPTGNWTSEIIHCLQSTDIFTDSSATATALGGIVQTSILGPPYYKSFCLQYVYSVSTNSLKYILWFDPEGLPMPSMESSSSFNPLTPNHICITKNVLASTIEYKMYINSNLEAILSTNKTTGLPALPADPTDKNYYTGFSSSFQAYDGVGVGTISGFADSYVSNFAYYDYVLPYVRIKKHFDCASVYAMPTFNYLYAKDSTYWDSMLNIATADMGMFYIDEYGFLKYEYKDVLHDGLQSRFQNSQYSLSDDTNIVSGDLNSEVQTNKVKVKINKSSFNASETQNLWSAESGESLAVSVIKDIVTPFSTSIRLKNVSEPLWLPSGYIKINDEIIKYERKVNNFLHELTRGMFGTEVGYHNIEDRAREARFYNITYSDSPAVVVNYPFITQDRFEKTVDVDYLASNAFSTKLLISARDPGPSVKTLNGIDYYYTNGPAYTNLVILNGDSPLTDANNYFVISGVSAVTEVSNELITEYSEEVRDNIRKYQIKELEIDNEFIGNKIYAKQFAKHILTYFSDPVRIINLDVIGVPHLQLGDLVTVTSFKALGISNVKFWVIQNSISYDGGLLQSLVLREYSSPAARPKFIL